MARETQTPPYRILNTDRARLGVTEDEPHKFTAEASSLGFPVGEFPQQIQVDWGNSMPLVRVDVTCRNGDLLWVDYRQAAGCVSLRVYND